MRFKYKPLILVFTLSLLYSCINNADFNQVDIDATPVLNFPLVFFELDQLDFLDDTSTIELDSITDVTEFDAFQSSTVRQNLGRVDLLFEIENMFDRNFQVEVDFLDDQDNITYSFQDLTIASGIDFIELRESVIIERNPLILNTTKARITVRLSSSSGILDPDVEQRFSFKSVGIFYLFF